MLERIAASIRVMQGGSVLEPIPRWMTAIRAGAFDRRVLDQASYWIKGEGAVLAINDMSVDHLLNTLQMLQRAAQPLHLQAMVDAILDDGGRLDSELITYQLTGAALQEATPEQWLETTHLVRAIHRNTARSPRAGPPAPAPDAFLVGPRARDARWPPATAWACHRTTSQATDPRSACCCPAGRQRRPHPVSGPGAASPRQ